MSIPRSSGAEPWLAGSPQTPPDGGPGVGVSAGGAVTTMMNGVAVSLISGVAVGGPGTEVTTITTGVLVGVAAGGVGVLVAGTAVEVGIIPGSGVGVSSAGGGA